MGSLQEGQETSVLTTEDPKEPIHLWRQRVTGVTESVIVALSVTLFFTVINGALRLAVLLRLRCNAHHPPLLNDAPNAQCQPQHDQHAAYAKCALQTDHLRRNGRGRGAPRWH